MLIVANCSLASIKMQRRTALITSLVLVIVVAGTIAGAYIWDHPYLSPHQPAQFQVVAGENFWGSLMSQLGGTHVQVLSIVTDPNADPHEYESNSVDAQA